MSSVPGRRATTVPSARVVVTHAEPCCCNEHSSTEPIRLTEFTGAKTAWSKLLLTPPAYSTVAGVLLAVSRAVGETMIVVMAASGVATLTLNPFASTTTVTKQIVDLLTGEAAFASAKTLAAFALGLTLFVVTLLLNVVALMVVRRYREAYE